MKTSYIPDYVNIIDSTIVIKSGQASNSLGFADYVNRAILIDPTASESMEQEVFFHELTHWILYKMGSRLEGDENFVCLFGSLLNQSMKTVIEKAMNVNTKSEVNKMICKTPKRVLDYIRNNKNLF